MLVYQGKVTIGFKSAVNLYKGEGVSDYINFLAYEPSIPIGRSVSCDVTALLSRPIRGRLSDKSSKLSRQLSSWSGYLTRMSWFGMSHIIMPVGLCKRMMTWVAWKFPVRL